MRYQIQLLIKLRLTAQQFSLTLPGHDYELGEQTLSDLEKTIGEGCEAGELIVFEIEEVLHHWLVDVFQSLSVEGFFEFDLLSLALEEVLRS